MKIKFRCLSCRCPIERTPREVARGRGKFCSRKCKGKHQTMEGIKRRSRPCQVCERPFLLPSNHLKGRGKFCSRKCKGWQQSIEAARRNLKRVPYRIKPKEDIAALAEEKPHVVNRRAAGRNWKRGIYKDPVRAQAHREQNRVRNEDWKNRRFLEDLAFARQMEADRKAKQKPATPTSGYSGSPVLYERG